MPNTTRRVLALWGMARPLIMLSVIQAYIVGTLIALARGYPLDVESFVWGLVALLPVASSIHYTNEYVDYQTDALTRRTPFSGGSGVLPSGLVKREVALWAALATLWLGGILALIGFILGVLDWPALLLLAIGAFGGWMYSLPPLALAWRGWGELVNAVLGGIVLSLFGYAVQSGQISEQVMLACIPFTGLAFLNLLATTWADRWADAQVGKRTLATQIPVLHLRILYGLVALMSFGLLPVFYGTILPAEVAAASALALPLVVWGAWHYTRTSDPHHSVYAMVVMLTAQMAGWLWVGG